MLKEGALRKKLQEIGIPNWGSKDLLKRRHIEWLNIYNSNCDAHESVRKSKKQLVKELEEWENTQGGKADTKGSKIMKKEFDGDGYAKSHKTDFDDLIAKARAKRAAPKPEETPAAQPDPVPSEPGATQPNPAGVPSEASRDTVESTPLASHLREHAGPRQNLAHHNPYENNESALSTIRAKVAAANQTGRTIPPLPSAADDEPHHPIGMQNPLGDPARKVPMFALPEQPVADTDTSSGAR
jgi:E3 ubiquitin-protein ligase RAD18